ncbi:hypothetical protein [Mycobacterium sp. MUNTM1]
MSGEMTSSASMLLVINARRHGSNGSRYPNDANGVAICATTTGGQGVCAETIFADFSAGLAGAVGRDFSRTPYD